MDAVEFLKEKNRMCKSIDRKCSRCKIDALKDPDDYCTCSDIERDNPAGVVKVVEQWSKEHPRKTRQSEFLKMFPRVDKALDGVVAFCPENMDSEFECALKRDGNCRQCTDCRKKYWLEEVEE